jgi:hypothetical protein
MLWRDRQRAAHAFALRGKRVSLSVNGTPLPVHRVQQVSGAEGGKRMALDKVATTTKGSFKSRKMGGLRHCKNESVFAMQSGVDEGIGSRATRNKREEANMHSLACDDGASLDVV